MNPGGLRIGLALVLIALTGLARSDGEYSVSGTNTLRLEHYDVSGDPSAAPYTSLGWQGYDEVNLNGQYQVGAYDQWRLQFAGVMNDSDYRSQYGGGVVERFAVVRENGAGRTPYRAEFGDLLGFYSLRTLQQSVKGGQVEWQRGDNRSMHSLVVTAGVLGQQWRALSGAADDQVLGASWVNERADGSRFAANVVNSHRGADGIALERDQTVYSVAAARSLKHIRGQTDVEAEVAFLRGDHDGTSGAASGQDRHASALFGQLSGRNPSGVLDYRVRYERNGQDFRPRAAVVSPDHEALEGFLGYRLPAGRQLRGRVQRFVDQWESSDPNRSRVLGVTLSGALAPTALPRLSGNVDAFVQRQATDSRSSDTFTRALTVSLNHPLGQRFNGRLSASFNDVNDHVSGNNAITRTLGADLDVPVQRSGWDGNLSFGVQYRLLTPDSSGQQAYAPHLAMQVAKGPHSLNLDLSAQWQDMSGVGSTNVNTFTPNLGYRYQRGPHVLGVDYSYSDRDPAPGVASRGQKVSFYWTYSFERSGQYTPGRRITTPSVAAHVQVPGMYGVAPGMTLGGATARLRAAGIEAGVSLQGLRVYETHGLESLPRRQRLGLLHRGDTVQTVVLAIDIDNPADGTALLRQYEEARRLFLDRLGNPTRFLERGAADPNVAAEIRAGRFVRVTEWQLGAATLRLGLPQRLDGQVRIEVQYTDSGLPPISQTRWSLEALR